MSSDISLEQLRSLFKGEGVRHPRMGDAVRKCLGSAAETIEQIGLPSQIGDSFKAVDEISVFPIPTDCAYYLQQKRFSVHRAVEIGRSEFGSYVVDCDSGCVVYIDVSGATQLINTSVERFLFFEGRFRHSESHRFSDIEELIADCRQVDEAPLSDSNGMWSVMIEEARAGLY